MRLIGVALVAGGAFFAWRQGWVNDYLPEGFPRPPSTPLDVAQIIPTPASADNVEQVETKPTDLTKEEKFLSQHMGFVSSFAQDHSDLAAAIMWQESRGKPSAVSSAGALGLMQVMPTTGQHMFDIGYKRIEPTRANLLTPEGSIYFGTAYMEYLGKRMGGKNWEWFIRSYNAGPRNFEFPHRFAGGGKNSENDGYWNAVSKRWVFIASKNGRGSTALA